MQFLKSLSFLVFISVVVIFQSCSSQKQSVLSKKYSPTRLQEDAEVFNKVVLAMHPTIGMYRDRNYYSNLLSSFKNDLNDSLTEKQFRFKLKLLADELHCGHTEVMASKATYRAMNKLKLNFSPFVFLPVNDKLYMIANLNKKQDSVFKKGMEVTKINGLAVDSMLRYSKRFISGDGFNQTGKTHYIQLGFNSYFLSIFGRPDTFDVEYKTGTTLKQIKYAAIQLKTMPPLPIGANMDSLFVKYKRAKMSYRYLGNDKKNMLLKIDKFSHRKYNKAYGRIFKRLKDHKTENLIIDLRNNGGGSLGNTYRLLSYLLEKEETQTLKTAIKKYPYKKYTKGNIGFKITRFVYTLIGRKKTVNDTDDFIYTIHPKQKNRFTGKIYVLINGGSFSASCLVSAYLKHNNRAIFIGEETGGTLEGCNAGITPYYRLPNTGLKIRVPAFRIVHDVNPSKTGRGLLPDYKIEYTVKDIIGKRDLELLKVKELLKIE